MITDEKYAELTKDCINMIVKMLDTYQDPFAVAASLSQMALAIYKTKLTDEEYHDMCEIIFDSRHDISPIIHRATLQ